MPAAQWFERRWFRSGLSPALACLFPLNWLFSALSALRRFAYRRAWLRAERLPVAVIVVGNLTVGGAGKTPLTLWLARALVAAGRQPGIVSRGYGGRAATPSPVLPESDPGVVGDEPLLLARRSGMPVWIGKDRVAAGRALLAAHPDVNVLLCDDGLQHYRLGRDAELAVFDGRGAGNGRLLPVGPLREPLSRLGTVDAIVLNDFTGEPGQLAAPGVPCFAMRLRPGRFYRLDDPGRECGATELARRPLHAVCGIGHPDRFFATLAGLGLAFVAHRFPDHHVYAASDLDFGPGSVVLMTEKDAVKCSGLTVGEAWVLPVDAEIDSAIIELLLEKICGRQTA